MLEGIGDSKPTTIVEVRAMTVTRLQSVLLRDGLLSKCDEEDSELKSKEAQIDAVTTLYKLCLFE